MPLGTSLFLWLRDNKYAQYLTVGAVGVFIVYVLDKLRISRIRREARAKAERKAEKQADKIITEMETRSDERIQKAADARERVRDDPDSGSLSDRARAILFRTGSDRSGGGGY